MSEAGTTGGFRAEGEHALIGDVRGPFGDC